jgi:nitrile hydratase
MSGHDPQYRAQQHDHDESDHAAGSTHDHAHSDPHDHDHHHANSELSEMDLRVRALESLLVEKGYVDAPALDVLIETYEHQVGPRNGARVVARAWSDPAYRSWLLEDASAAIASLGYTGRQGEHMVALENTPQVHNMVVCTLCSCYPWSVLDPRGVLKEFGFQLPPEVEFRVWDSTAELRYLVLPMRPAATDGWSEAQLAELVTRDSMIGTGIALEPGALHATQGEPA